MGVNWHAGHHFESYLSFDHVAAIFSHIQCDAKYINTIFVTYVLQQLVHGDEDSSFAHSSTASMGTGTCINTDKAVIIVIY